ncbi:protein AATF [Neodiprion fabricii]|uniref:protein AATF n=1 Tax=Neodiprion fabricii TaxID=2872261 RepID=UPI001ED913B2|nr:protein AATF [Neodiprion fabricii]
MALKGKRLSLADKISSLVSSAPTSFDSDDEYDVTKAKLVERDTEEENSDLEVRKSNFRTQNVDLLDEVDKRYEGKKVSRKSLQREASPVVESLEDSELENGSFEEDDAETSDSGGGDSDESDEEVETDSDNEPELEIDNSNPLRRRGKSEMESNFKHMSLTDSRAEIEKGRCVRSQLGIWENLLEMRIKLQKCLISSNKMPQYDIHKDLRADKTFVKSTNESQKNLTKLLDNLLNLQSSLLIKYPETKLLVKNKEASNNASDKEESRDDNDEEIPSDTEEEKEAEEEKKDEEEEERVPRKKRKVNDYESLLAKNHNLYTNYRNSVIQKWNDKTRIAVGNVNTKGSTQPVVKQIEFILSDKSKLRKRAQLKRSEYEIVGKQQSNEAAQDGRREQEYDGEIYDDDDFYHQLLRELIEFKSADITDPIQLSKQWIQLQNMRSKMKRKIDTKATKGRRIRFGVHSKLVNFMAPITVDDNWTDLAKNELYSSLFGKIKEVEQK